MTVSYLAEGQGASVYAVLFNSSIVKLKRWMKIFLFFLKNITSWTCLLWSELDDIFHFYARFRIFNKSLQSIEAEAFAQLTAENKQVLSTKSLTSNSSPCGKSLI